MARRRMIDPGIWGSEDFAHLTYIERLLWIGLFSNADDYGKGRAATAFLRSMIFPYDNISLTAIEKALKRLAEIMEINLYEVGDARYYRLTAWTKWQQVSHPVESTIPDQTTESFRNDSGSIPAKPLRNEFNEFKEFKGPPESPQTSEGVRPSAMRPDPLSDENRKNEIKEILADISARSGLSGGHK